MPFTVLSKSARYLGGGVQAFFGLLTRKKHLSFRQVLPVSPHGTQNNFSMVSYLTKITP